MKDQKRFTVPKLSWMAILLCLVLSDCGKDDKITTTPPVTVGSGLGKVQAYVTSGDQSRLLSKDNDLTLTAKATTTFPVIVVDTTTLYQEMEGFGAAVTGSAAYVINKLSGASRAALITDLFDPTDGIGISYIRVPIGASDFALKDYSYDDLPNGQTTDYTMSNFSLDIDKTDLIPVLQAIVAESPSIKILGSPWSPPSWMKSNGSMEGGSLNTDAYDAYAHYFVDYVNGMKDQGITIDALTMQNEPLYGSATYPCMNMSADEQNNFIKNNVGPLFAEEGITTKILAYDHNWDNTSYAMEIINDPVTSQYVAGSAFHGYGGTSQAMTAVHNSNPNKGMYFTEISGGGWATDFGSNLGYFVGDIFIGTTKNWSKNALLWNLALDENDGPKNNGCSNCRGVVTVTSTGTITKNVEYYSTAHFSKFVRPGAHRMLTSLTGTFDNFDFVGFINPDGSKALIVINRSGDPRTFYVQQPARQFNYALPANSVVTFSWK